MDRRLEKTVNSQENSAKIKQPKLLVFDILALNDVSLLDQPLKYRKKILAQKLNLAPASGLDSSVIECGHYKRLKHYAPAQIEQEVQTMQNHSLSINCEGLVIK